MEIPETIKYNCTNPECDIAKTGKCVNGQTVAECTNKFEVVAGDLSVTPEIPEVALKKTSIALPWGNAFTVDNLHQLTYQYSANLIVAAGEPSGGKSTLYAALFDSFHKGHCGEYYFVNTKTPFAFEEICHFAREKCKGKEPDAERTKREEVNFLHLAVKHKSLKSSVKHLIFVDISGEIFQDAKNSDELMKQLNIIKRASQLFFIADGKLLMSDEHRQSSKNDIFKLISRAKQNNMLPDKSQVTVILTKWDKIVEAKKEEAINDFFIKPIVEKFNDSVNKVLAVASRSLSESVPSRLGISEFLEICLSEKDQAFESNFSPSINREFQRFKYGSGSTK
jgi:GTP-binding protein EngB required for normal cell division